MSGQTWRSNRWPALAVLFLAACSNSSQDSDWTPYGYAGNAGSAATYGGSGNGYAGLGGYGGYGTSGDGGSYAGTGGTSAGTGGTAAGTGGTAAGTGGTAAGTGGTAAGTGGTSGTSGTGGTGTSCPTGYADCNNDSSDGCETAINTLDDCGGCGIACALDNATATCASGTCAIDTCDPGYGDCNDADSDGCEQSLDTLEHCTGCGVPCAFDNAAASCDSGTCEMGDCASDYEDCNTDESDGCEIDLTGDPDNCGSCGHACGPYDNAEPVCDDSACGMLCDDLYGDCNTDIGDGCETDLTTLDDCGACDVACGPLYNAIATCASGTCEVEDCDTDYADCDGDPANGCEYDLGGAPDFEYTTSNFNPTGLLSNACPVTLSCGVSTFNSTTLAYDNWCGQAEPVPVVQSDVVIIPLSGLTVASGATLRLVGDRPVILAVFGDAAINGTVDASASGTTPGAGGNLSCGSAAGGNGQGSSSSGGGGGGGGAFGTAGGDGGSGDNGTPGDGGTPRGTADLIPLQGGCPGGRGGGCSSPAGAAGGGAVQLSVSGSLTVTGTIRANGGNGQTGCGSEGGGTGGGSGGAILLEGETVNTGSATITANGGNGGRGSGGGNGGAGSTSPGSPGSDGHDDSSNGGGAGGGGYGRVVIKS